MDLETAKVLITGGSAGIGLETARVLQDAGAAVAICGRDPERLARAGDQLNCLAVRADVSEEGDVENLVREAVEGLGGLNVVVNNAAYGYFAPLVDVELEPFEQMLRTNLVGAMLVGRACARLFAEQKSGHIVNVGSTAARRGFPRGTAYAASKFALAGMTECWRAELRSHGVRVTQIDPSQVLTGFGGSTPPESDRKLRPAEIAHMIKVVLELDDRGFVPSFEVWATNPD